MRRPAFCNFSWVLALFLTGCPLLNPFLEAPESAFEGAPAYGAAPLTVIFTDLSEAGTANIEEWQWDFGDGTTSTLRSPSHIYTTPGDYTVSLTVTTSVGTHTALVRDYIQVVEEPDADFSAAPERGGAPLTVSFVDISMPGSSPIAAWEWNFGDRSPISTEQHPNHVYTAPGRYTVSLKVTTEVGANKETKAAFIDVVAAPDASFTSDFSPGVAPLEVSFTDTSTTGTAPVLSWAWDFGDGGMSSDQNPSHTYAGPGVYTVGLTVETVGGADQEIKVGYITVDQGPVAAFTGVPVTGPAPLSVTFTDESVPGTQAINRRVWDFGDGGLLSSLANPVRVYNVPGTYDVSLRVTTSAGSNNILKPAYIIVTDGAAEGEPVMKSAVTAADWLAADISAIASDASGDVWAVAGATSPVVLRLNESGEQCWGVALSHGASLALHAVHAPGDGTVYVAGTLGRAAWAARFDALGELIWEHRDGAPLDSMGAGLASGPDGTILLGLLRTDTLGGSGLHVITLGEDGRVLDTSPALSTTVDGSSLALTSSGQCGVLALATGVGGTSALSRLESDEEGGAAAASRIGTLQGLPVAISILSESPGYLCAVRNGEFVELYQVSDEGLARHLLNVPAPFIALDATADGTRVTWLSTEGESGTWRIERESIKE